MQKLRQSRDAPEIDKLLTQLGPLGTERQSSIAISAWARVGDWARSLDALASMRLRKLQPDAVCYSGVLSACDRAKEWSRALGLLADMELRGIEPNMSSYSAAASACQKAGQGARTLALLNQMRTRELKPDRIVYSAVISACSRAIAFCIVPVVSGSPDASCSRCRALQIASADEP